VQVSRVDLDGRRIDFRMVKEPGAAWASPRGRTASAEPREPASPAELLAQTLNQDRAVKAKTKKARTGGLASGKASGRTKPARGLTKGFQATPGSKKRRR